MAAVPSPEDDIPIGPEPEDEGPAPRRPLRVEPQPARSGGWTSPTGGGRPSGGAGRRTPPPVVEPSGGGRRGPSVDDGEDADPDDPDLSTTGLIGAPLVAQMLGGTVIDEIPDDPR